MAAVDVLMASPFPVRGRVLVGLALLLALPAALAGSSAPTPPLVELEDGAEPPSPLATSSPAARGYSPYAGRT